ncbi:MAG: hypothetical protein IPJ65_35940 [Archangiaceae bacterium]|nr:hypothetical protein [Archangiaceae bacterium]
MSRIASVLLPSLLACSGGGPPAMPDAGDVGCKSRSGADVYAAGMSKRSSSGRVMAVLLSADPAPPERGNNAWSVKLTGARGEALDGELAVTPYMPEHGHGTSVAPGVERQGDGSWKVSPLYLFMPGIWEVTLAPSADAGAADSPVFSFCIDG